MNTHADITQTRSADGKVLFNVKGSCWMLFEFDVFVFVRDIDGTCHPHRTPRTF